jgi:citrate synthase
MAWMTGAQALAVLGVQPQTLYANVSRGRIRAKPDPKDSRRSLYNSEDVKRLASRAAGRRPAALVAAAAIGWGDPVLASGVSTTEKGRLWYRGRDAVALSESAGLEEVASLLWETGEIRFGCAQNAGPRAEAASSPLEAALIVLSRRAGAAAHSLGRPRAELVAEAADLVDELAAAMLGPATMSRGPLHQRLAAAWRAPKAECVLRRALVLLADHELNASTFAARVAASTGASLSACLLSGLATLTGPLHGGAGIQVRLLAAAARQLGADKAVRDRLAQGRQLPAFGHPLYPDGDPRAFALFEHFTPSPAFAELRAAAETSTGEQPNVDFAISAMADAFDLPLEAPIILFAVARSVGWIAHSLEQLSTGTLIRPRARYAGPPITRFQEDPA